MHVSCEYALVECVVVFFPLFGHLSLHELFYSLSALRYLETEGQLRKQLPRYGTKCYFWEKAFPLWSHIATVFPNSSEVRKAPVLNLF